MATLCLDIGNTHTHWGLVNQRNVLKYGEFLTPALGRSDIEKLIAEHQPQAIALASVVPMVSNKLEEFLKNSGRPFVQLKFDRLIGLGFDYPNPAEVGQDRLADCLIAYEPVWAIGTGKVASAQVAQDMHRVIRLQLAEFDEDVASHVGILYGGSVKPDNAVELFAMPDIDGGLIGGASLDPQEFLAICQA